MRGRWPGQRDDHRAPELSSGSHPGTVVVQGRELSFPVEVRRASSWAAQFLVRADAAQRLIEHTGLRIARLPLGRGVLSLAFVRYEDSDLGAYHELGMIFYVWGPRGRGVYVHHLPVDQEFTLAAGRQVWGYPKFAAEVGIEERDGGATCTLRHDGHDVLELTVHRGLFPIPQPALKTYTWLDGTLRVTRWRSRGLARAQLWGATVRLGTHPIADELRSLGLPRPARMTSIVPRFSARFDAPTVLPAPR